MNIKKQIGQLCLPEKKKQTGNGFELRVWVCQECDQHSWIKILRTTHICTGEFFIKIESERARYQRISNMCNIKAAAANKWDGDSCRRFPSGLFIVAAASFRSSLVYMCIQYTLCVHIYWLLLSHSHHLSFSCAFPWLFGISSSSSSSSSLWSFAQILKRTHLRFYA